MKKIYIILAMFLILSEANAAENFSDSFDELDFIAEPQSIINIDKKAEKNIKDTQKETDNINKKIEKAIKRAEETISEIENSKTDNSNKTDPKIEFLEETQTNIKNDIKKIKTDINEFKNELVQELKVEKDGTTNIDKFNQINIAISKKDASKYKKELKKSGIKYTKENFIKEAEKNNTETVRLFLLSGMKPDVANNSNTTPLIWASFNGNIEIVKMLLSANANVNTQNRDGFTPLHAAVENGNTEIVKYLLSNGAKVNTALYSDRTTPLHTACFKGNKDIVQILVVAGADVNAKNIHGATPVVTAAFYDKKDIVNYLNANGSNFNINSDDGKVLTTAAITENKSNSFKTLVLSGVDPNTRDKDGKTMLQSATEQSDIESVQFLLSKHADVNVSFDRDSVKNITPIHTAVMKQNLPIVKTLIDNGAEINVQEANIGTTPLIIAILTGNEDIAANLIFNGADVNISTFDGFTPADIALAKKDEILLKKLLQNGALFGKKTGALLVQYGCSVKYDKDKEKVYINPDEAIAALNEFENDEHQDYNSYMRKSYSFRNSRDFEPDKHAYKVYPLLFELMQNDK